MSKEKKPTPKPKTRKPTLKEMGVPTLNEMVDMEFSIPDVMIGTVGSDIDDYEKWIEKLQKRAGKHFFKQGELVTKSNDNIDTLLIYLDKYPELFAEEYDEINRDMVKWSLNESIKKHRELIDKIQEIEKKLGLSIHHEW